jgi:cyclopropane fatty-acyl-phospholipid synthase-like methyltransferase
MQTIYLWINDFEEHKDEIEEQLIYENQQEKIFKVVLCYVESLIWEMEK